VGRRPVGALHPSRIPSRSGSRSTAAGGRSRPPCVLLPVGAPAKFSPAPPVTKLRADSLLMSRSSSRGSA
jgi:hypothetical protein